MEDLFVSYDLALLANQKGFNLLCFNKYDKNKKIMNDGYYSYSKPATNKGTLLEFPAAPLYQQLVDWFRVKYDIIVGVDYERYNSCGFIKHRFHKENSLYKHIWTNTDSDNIKISYYDALDLALNKAFKLI